jgi:hypothetical protein
MQQAAGGTGGSASATVITPVTPPAGALNPLTGPDYTQWLSSMANTLIGIANEINALAPTISNALEASDDTFSRHAIISDLVEYYAESVTITDTGNMLVEAGGFMRVYGNLYLAGELTIGGTNSVTGATAIVTVGA